MRRALTRVFHCPNCNRVIRATLDRCKYCHAPIDRRAAHAAADREAEISQASLEADLIRESIPRLGDAHDERARKLLFVVLMPFFVIPWLIRYRGVPASDPDFVASKRTVVAALALWVPLMIALVLWLAR